MKRITIYDVAKEAGVSLATVSRVMNGSDAVKSQTKNKVEEAITKLGYKPNAIAQGLALQRTTTIGLIFPNSAFAYNEQLINGLCDVAKIYDYTIALHTISEGITNIQEVVDEVIKSRVDGVVIYSDKPLDESTKLLDEYAIPMVVIGNKVASNAIASAYINYEDAVIELCEKYLDKGIKDIMIMEDRKNENVTSAMLKGARSCFESKGLVFNNYLEYSSDERSTYKYLKDYFETHKHQLMIVNRDSQALAVLNAARENGIKIPEDMELVCMTDSKFTSMVRPEISAYTVPSYDLGAVSMRLMTKMLKDDSVEDKEKVLNCLFLERQTTKR